MDVVIKAADDFSAGQAAIRAGKNSRSGASFVWSSSKAFVAKRIRDFEYEALWRISHGSDCGYSKQFNQSSPTTLLNSLLLAFIVEDEPWYIMKAEKGPSELSALLPPPSINRREVWDDVKPQPLTSDLEKFGTMLQVARMSTGLTLNKLNGMDRSKRMMNSDLDFLDRTELVDYSLLFFGAIVYKPKLSHLDELPAGFYWRRYGGNDFLKVPATAAEVSHFESEYPCKYDTTKTIDGYYLVTSLDPWVEVRKNEIVQKPDTSYNWGDTYWYAYCRDTSRKQAAVQDASSSQWWKGAARDELTKAVDKYPGCVFGCSSRKEQLVDVTRHLDKDGLVTHRRTSYKCCCNMQSDIREWVQYPCVLVDRASSPKLWGEDDCDNLLWDDW